MRWIGTIVGIMAVGATFMFAPDSRTGDATTSADPSVQRGRYLVTIGGCNDCHTPHVRGPHGVEPDATRLLSGHPQDLALPAPKPPDGPWRMLTSESRTAFAGPWGVSYARNLTPDRETGIGS